MLKKKIISKQGVFFYSHILFILNRIESAAALENSMRINYKWVSCFITFPSIVMFKVNSCSLGWLKCSVAWIIIKICKIYFWCILLFLQYAISRNDFKHILYFKAFIANKISILQFTLILSNYFNRSTLVVKYYHFPGRKMMQTDFMLASIQPSALNHKLGLNEGFS